ncbi:hypothetical protein RUM43_004657 [Polyplax serrata]|uniref:LysM domain-containing protein n=1 Tax=Polyplax serrata TaxID=468196 RepID=A0AAN8SC06_POLSC
MKKNFTNFKNQVYHMPLYNRSHGQNKNKCDEDVALSTHKKQVFLEKEIKLDDTLQSVALEFNVPVAELKRINNIHKDNEIFARKVIKVPANPLSILLERDYFAQRDPEIDSPPQGECDVIVETINNSNSVTLNNVPKNNQSEQEKREFPPAVSEEAQEYAALLNTTVEHKTSDVMSCSGADWGIPWHVLLLVTIVLGLGGPFIYVFWLFWGRKAKAAGS